MLTYFAIKLWTRWRDAVHAAQADTDERQRWTHLWEGTLGEDDEETSLSTSTVTNDDELSSDLRHVDCC